MKTHCEYCLSIVTPVGTACPDCGADLRLFGNLTPKPLWVKLAAIAVIALIVGGCVFLGHGAVKALNWVVTPSRSN